MCRCASHSFFAGLGYDLTSSLVRGRKKENLPRRLRHLGLAGALKTQLASTRCRTRRVQQRSNVTATCPAAQWKQADVAHAGHASAGCAQGFPADACIGATHCSEDSAGRKGFPSTNAWHARDHSSHNGAASEAGLSRGYRHHYQTASLGTDRIERSYPLQGLCRAPKCRDTGRPCRRLTGQRQTGRTEIKRYMYESAKAELFCDTRFLRC